MQQSVFVKDKPHKILMIKYTPNLQKLQFHAGQCSNSNNWKQCVFLVNSHDMIYYEPQLLCLSIHCTKLISSKNSKQSQVTEEYWQQDRSYINSKHVRWNHVLLRYVQMRERQMQIKQKLMIVLIPPPGGSGLGRETQVYFKGIGNILFPRWAVDTF